MGLDVGLRWAMHPTPLSECPHKYDKYVCARTDVWVRLFTWGKGSAEASSTFSGFRSQWTMFLKCRCLSATRICTNRCARPQPHKQDMNRVQYHRHLNGGYDTLNMHHGTKIRRQQRTRSWKSLRHWDNNNNSDGFSVTYNIFVIQQKPCLMEHIHTCVMRNLVSLSGSRPFSLERIISSMSPCSFSITTKTFSGVSNMHSRFTIPRWRKLWENGSKEEETGKLGSVWSIREGRCSRQKKRKSRKWWT